jgi:hypothetical protein
LAVGSAGAQEKTPAAPEPQRVAGEELPPLRVSVEEVRVPVAAYDEGGRFDPTLTVEDLLVREDGVAQQVRGVYRVPAYVLLVVDTGGELNPAKNFRLTREVAVSLVSSLRAANVTVHVISYTAMGRGAKRPASTRPRVESKVPKEAIMALPRNKRPNDPRPDLKEQLEAKGGMVLDLERLLRRDKEVKAELQRREAEFATLTAETGGELWLPASAAEMLAEATEAARAIDAQYVVTYKPQRPLAVSAPGEYRKLDVFPRRVGLKVHARRVYLVAAQPE